VLESREHEQLAGNELVAALLCQLVSDVEKLVEIAGDVDLAGRPLDSRQPVEKPLQLGAQLVDVDTGFEQQGTYAAALAVEHGEQYVRRLHELMVASERQRLCIGQCLLEFAREFVLPHKGYRRDRLGCREGGGKPESVQAGRSTYSGPGALRRRRQ